MSKDSLPGADAGQRSRTFPSSVHGDAAARELLDRLARRNPNDEKVWLALASLSRDPREQLHCFRQVLRINPRNHQAVQCLRRLDSGLELQYSIISVPHTEAMAESSPLPGRGQTQARRWLVISLLLVVLVVAVGGFVAQARVARVGNLSTRPTPLGSVPTLTSTPVPTATSTPSVADRIAAVIPDLEQAWEQRDWATAEAVLQGIQSLDAAYPGLQAARCDTYLHWAGDLTARAQVKEAYSLYHKAMQVCSEEPSIQAHRSLALTYLTGKWRYEHGLWRQAALTLQSIYDLDPAYANTASLLYESYMAWGQASAEQQDYRSAQSAYQSILSFQPANAEVAALLSEAEARLLPTPTPVPPDAGKRIEVNISEQRMYVWEGDKLLYNWLCSTGEPGRNTAPGHYQILDKIPEAWASTWSLRMPYWMGIYYAGTLENGIHALPILPNGQILWDGYLGTPVSFGCVILSTQNAQTLYNWARVGTPVWIHY